MIKTVDNHGYKYINMNQNFLNKMYEVNLKGSVAFDYFNNIRTILKIQLCNINLYEWFLKAAFYCDSYVKR